MAVKVTTRSGWRLQLDGGSDGLGSLGRGFSGHVSLRRTSLDPAAVGLRVVDPAAMTHGDYDGSTTVAVDSVNEALGDDGSSVGIVNLTNMVLSDDGGW